MRFNILVSLTIVFITTMIDFLQLILILFGILLISFGSWMLIPLAGSVICKAISLSYIISIKKIIQKYPYKDGESKIVKDFQIF